MDKKKRYYNTREYLGAVEKSWQPWQLDVMQKCHTPPTIALDVNVNSTHRRLANR